MKRILVVDETKSNINELQKMLCDEYELVSVENNDKAIQLLADGKEDFLVTLICLDKAKKSAYQLLESMNKQKILDEIPAIVISDDGSIENEKRNVMLGALAYVRKPIDKDLLKMRIKNIIEFFRGKKLLERKVEEQTVTMRKQYKLLLMQSEKLKENNEKIIDVLGSIIEYRNMENESHIQCVKKIIEVLATELAKMYPKYDLNEKTIKMIVSASSLHDIGKIAIPDSILLKPGKLTDDEFEYMKSHASKGAEMVSKMQGIWSKEFQKVCYEICRYHHERYDGSGYPDGLKGDNIPISAQLVAVADVFDALVTERVYHAAVPFDKAFQMILSGECGMFSPDLMDSMRNIKGKLQAIVEEEKRK